MTEESPENIPSMSFTYVDADDSKAFEHVVRVLLRAREDDHPIRLVFNTHLVAQDIPSIMDFSMQDYKSLQFKDPTLTRKNLVKLPFGYVNLLGFLLKFVKHLFRANRNILLTPSEWLNVTRESFDSYIESLPSEHIPY
jgi:hypothetical protein